MVIIESQSHFRDVAKLPFCYWCGEKFIPGDELNDDHVPPKNAFDKLDRTPPLKLRTHKACNSAHTSADELVGQLVALRRDYVTPDPKNRRLKMEVYPGQGFGAVTNINVVDAVWSYIRGFHAALYREPLPGQREGAITTPFTRAWVEDGELVLEGAKQQQHFMIVETIKRQRALANVDRIVSNNGKVVYECVWVIANDVRAVASGSRALNPRPTCFFALDIYGWKELGDIGQGPARGCAGAYILSMNHAPTGAARFIETSVTVPNQDPWDPFGP